CTSWHRSGFLGERGSCPRTLSLRRFHGQSPISLTGVTKCRIPHYQRVGSRALEVKGASGSTSRKDYRGRGARVGQPFPKQRGGDRDLSLQAFGTTRLLGRCCSSPVCRTPYSQ